MPRLHLTIAVLAATVVFLGATGQVHAQMPPYTAYGMGLRPRDVVTASIDGAECGRATVSAAGNWKITISAEAPCHPGDGSIVRFAVNGVEHAVTARWSGGGAPPNPRVGIALGTHATVTATATRTTTPKATATPKVSPSKAATPKAKSPARATPKALRRG